MNLIDSLIAENWLKTPRIINAFKKIKRVDFLPEESKDLAETNEALAIGFGQTISQPLVVAFMIELLNPEPGNKILDIGFGSGWTSALLAEIVGKQGKIIAIELIPELKEFGQKNASKYASNIDFICADASKGYAREAPFDRIMASASLGNSVPKEWRLQLKEKGIMVAPIKNSIWKIQKSEEKEYPGFVFVPLIEK